MKFYLFLILKIFIALTNSQSQTNWYWQNPLPQGNDLNHIQFANNSTGFAVGNKGTFAKTTNGGENWSYNFQITGFNISSMAVINSNTIFISADKKIMRSTDSGIWWDTVGYSSYFAFSSLFFVDQNTGYSTTNNNFSEFGEVYKTTNGGSNWFHVNINSSLNATSCFFINSNTGWAAGWYQSQFGNNAHIFKTTDGGVSWTNQLNTADVPMNSVYFINENTGWAGGKYLWRTTNSGISWDYQGINVNNIKFTNSSTGYCVSDSNIYKTTNAGVDWILNGTMLYGNFITTVDSDNIWIVGGFGVIYKTSNAGIYWENLHNTLTNDYLFSVNFPDPNTGYISFGGGNLFSTRGGILKTSNKGEHWNFIYYDSSQMLENIYFVNSLTGWFPKANNINKTTDGGNSWNVQNLNPSGEVGEMFFMNPSTGWISVKSNGIYVEKTTNGGENWISQRVLDETWYRIFQVYFSNEQNGTLIGNNITSITSDGGLNWQSYTNNYSFSVSCNDDLGNLYACSFNKVYKSIDHGLSWQLKSNPINGNGFFSFKMVNSNTGYLGSVSGLLFKTSNGGVDWIRQNISALQIRSISAIDTNCWVVGDGGMILSTAGSREIVSDIKLNNIIIQEFFLRQNYPNPFNPNTTINYQLPVTKHVSLKVYDVIGKLVASLVNEKQNAGSYTVDFNGDGLPSGVYFYKLEAGEFTETKRMILLK